MRTAKKINITHLLPHTGGGVGTVLKALLGKSVEDGEYCHRILALERINEQTKKWCGKLNIEWTDDGWNSQALLCQRIADADIVHIHWWNHPQLHAFLSKAGLPNMRTVLWSHVNGMHVPQSFFQGILDFPDKFVFATRFSQESDLIGRQSEGFLCEKLEVIQSSAGIPPEAPAEIVKPDGFRVGYVGTVDYGKMHPDFISFWADADIRDAPYVVCGGPSHKQLEQEIDQQGLSGRFDIRGQVDNVFEILTDLHVFAYPLNHQHYGTGEQVLIEAMAFGVVPIVLNNGCEKHLIQNSKTGMIVSGKDEFVQALYFLRDHPKIRMQMACNAHAYVLKKFGIEKTVSAWYRVYKELIKAPKRKHRMRVESVGDLPPHSPASLLLNSYDARSSETKAILSLLDCLAEGGEKSDTGVLPAACFAETRGSPFHYRSLLPEDPVLSSICDAFPQFFHSGRYRYE